MARSKKPLPAQQTGTVRLDAGLLHKVRFICVQRGITRIGTYLDPIVRGQIEKDYGEELNMLKAGQ